MIDPARLESAADTFGTPLYVYDLDAVRARIRSLRAALPERAMLAYAVKANPSLAVLRDIGATGVGADVASGGELAACLRAGFEAGRLVMTGPGKRDAELEAAVGAGVGAVTVESLGELDRLRGIARRHGRRVGVLVRAAGTPRSENVIGAGDGRFGMRWVDLVEGARIADASPELELLGLHRFDASNVLDADELLAIVRDTVTLAGRLARESGVRLGIIDVGGGLGIPYRASDPELDVEAFGRGIAGLCEVVDRTPELAGAHLLLEPGRYLVGPAGAYVSRVVDVKETDAGTVATLDGGVHHLARPALIGQPQRLRLVTGGAEDRRRRPVTVGGPLCTALDVVARGVMLPELRVGDLVAVLDAGAYGYTEAMPLFLSHPTPAEVVLDGGDARLARPPIDPSTFLEMQEPHVLTAVAGRA